jgi:hypothetical protein
MSIAADALLQLSGPRSIALDLRPRIQYFPPRPGMVRGPSLRDGLQ